MEELYRFLLLRSPEELDLETQTDEVVDLSQQSNFQEELQSASKQAERNSAASDFQQSQDFIPSPGDWSLGKGLLKIAYEYLGLAADKALPVNDLLQKCASLIASQTQAVGVDLSTGAAARNYLQSEVDRGDWEQQMSNVKDSILAIRESSLQTRGLTELVAVLHAMRLVERLLTTTEAELRPGKILQATLYLPGTRGNEMREELEVLPEEDREEIEATAREYHELKNTIEELLNVPTNLLDLIEDNETLNSNDPAGMATVDDSPGTIHRRKQVFLGQKSMARLSDNSKNTLVRLDIAHDRTDLVEVLDVLRAQQKKLILRKEKTVNHFSKGSRIVQLGMGEAQISEVRTPNYPSPFAPQTTGDVSPVGIGDLMIVKQKLKRYEGGDVAHIENVLQGETKLREHRRRHLTEDTFFEEEEYETKEEQETQSTNRFELRSEVQKQIQNETSIEAGVKVSAKYGPTVQIDADSKFAYKNAQSESRNRAATVSKELVEKAATSYTERFKSSKTRRILDEIEETNRHSLDATGASGHIVGVYQWVNKIYESQMYNYGQRVMYEFMVPEPASYYIWALDQGASRGQGLKIPEPFVLDANDIDEWNYADLAAIYGAESMPVPPEPFVTVEMNQSGGPNPEKGPMVGSDQVSIPKGYEYFQHQTEMYFTGVSDDPTRGFGVTVSSGYKTPGILPIIYRGYSIKSFSFFVHLLCRRTYNSMEEWRMKAWEALREGHQRQMANYEEKLAALLNQSGVEIKGQNPYFNRKVERKELQKSCLTLLTGSHPSWVNAMNETAIGPVPSLVWTKSHGAYVRFMEQAYEWENMSYVLYPYFWARSQKWLSLQAIEDVDPEFQEFLTSGYARVVVPVRPGFESAVEHFRQTGKVWSGGKLPDITDPDYLPIAEEIKARQNAGGEEIPVGEPWEVLLPTQLVKLRADNSLPEWEKQADGSWTEKQNPA